MIRKLPAEQRALICFAINRYGTGRHPAAVDNANLRSFTVGYIAECLYAAINSRRLDPDAAQLATDTLRRLRRLF
jgi:hypothetical protein